MTYITMCEIFIKIDSLQLLEVSRRTQPTNPKILFMLIFQNSKLFQINVHHAFLHDYSTFQYEVYCIF